ncbi:MAG: sigma-70 family RNA polymerase sigma factor, partial [Pirellulaceae bacterium]|nr:sigma-70 family RNA polymerase sigma factor [Pirellulaceae bacterium]
VHRYARLRCLAIAVTPLAGYPQTGVFLSAEGTLVDASLTSFPSTASSLLRRVQARDENAWRLLIDLYGPLVYGWLRRAGLSAEDAGDVTQETLLGVASAVGAFRQGGTGSFRGWLWTIARFKLIDFRRRREIALAAGGSVAQQQLAELAEQYPGDDDPVAGQPINALVHRALSQVQAEFEPHTWSAFWQVVVEDRSTADVATELGLSTNSVRQARSRVLRRLRAQLGDLEP